MDPLPRLYITFRETEDLIRHAVIPLSSTYDGALSDALKAFRLPQENVTESYRLTYGHKVGESICWMEISPDSWGIISTEDELLLYKGNVQHFAPSESTSTLVPTDVQLASSCPAKTGLDAGDEAKKLWVTYSLALSVKGVVTHIPAYATCLMPDTYQDARVAGVTALRQFKIAKDLSPDTVLLWVRILDEKGHRVNTVVPPTNFIDYLKETLKKDPFCQIAVIVPQ